MSFDLETIKAMAALSPEQRQQLYAAASQQAQPKPQQAPAPRQTTEMEQRLLDAESRIRNSGKDKSGEALIKQLRQEMEAKLGYGM